MWVRRRSHDIKQFHITDDLLIKPMAPIKQTTTTETEEKLRRVEQLRRQKLAGDAMARLGWDGDLDAMREDRDFPWRSAE